MGQSRTTFYMVSALALALVFAGCEDKEAEKKRIEWVKRQEAKAAAWKARGKTHRAEQCTVVAEAEAEAFLQGRIDLIEKNKGRDGCTRLRIEGCDYKVELLFELNKANKTTLSEKLTKIGEDCTDELKFATKHGLEAFHDHRALLETAVERAVEQARSD